MLLIRYYHNIIKVVFCNKYENKLIYVNNIESFVFLVKAGNIQLYLTNN
jgi:hypothetical protein